MKKITLLSLVCLIVMVTGIIFPACAEAFTSRSGSGGSTGFFSSRSTGYGVARSTTTSTAIPSNPQPSPEPDPPPAEEDPAPSPSRGTTYSSGSYGMARSDTTRTTYYTPPSSTPAPPPTTEPEPKPPVQDPPPPVSDYQPLPAEERLLLQLVNQEREARGLEPLILHTGLTETARLKSVDMIENNYYAHHSPTYGSPGDMIRAAGINFRLATENLCRGGGSMQTVLSAFMNSPGHRRQIINADYTHTGIGVYRTSSGYMVTQHFIQVR